MTPFRQRLLDSVIALFVLATLFSALWAWFWGTFDLAREVSSHYYLTAALGLGLVLATTVVAGAAAVRLLPVSRWVRVLWILVCGLIATWAVVCLAQSSVAPPETDPFAEPVVSQAIIFTLICPTTYPIVVAAIAGVVARLRGRSSRGRRSPQARSSAPGRRACV